MDLLPTKEIGAKTEVWSLTGKGRSWLDWKWIPLGRSSNWRGTASSPIDLADDMLVLLADWGRFAMLLAPCPDSWADMGHSSRLLKKPERRSARPSDPPETRSSAQVLSL